MATLLAGTYFWTDSYAPSTTDNYSVYFDYTSNGTDFIAMVIEGSNNGMTSYKTTASSSTIVYVSSIWGNENYRTFTVLSDQEVDSSYYDYVMANATFTPEPAKPLKFTAYKPTEIKSVTITENGETIIEATSGYAMDSVEITTAVPSDLTEIANATELAAFDITDNIGKYGLITADFGVYAAGNIVQVVETATEPQDLYSLAPIDESEEITADTVIQGYKGYNSDGELVEGIASSGGGGSSGEFLVQFIGYQGEVYQTGYYNTGDVVMLPNDPEHSGLTFQGWSSPVTVTDNTVTVTNQDLTFGAMFATESGATEIDVTLTLVGGLDVEIALFNNVTEIDWGDGSTSSELGTHTYDDYGSYTIKVYASDAMSDGTSTNGMFGTQSGDSPYYKVTEIRFANTITSIGAYAFYYCRSLTSITIPDSVTNIGDYAFYYCYALASVTMPNSVTSIGTYAFGYCCSLASVTIPDSVTGILTNTFYYCNSLTSIIIPDSVTSIGTSVFQYCYALASIDIPNSVTTIGTNMFSQCYSLANIAIPNSVTNIQSYAFRYCYALASIDIHNSVTTIGTSVFQYCHALASIDIPNSVTTIGQYAFNSCYNLTEYDFTDYTSTDTVPTLSGTNAFSNINPICKMYFRDQATLDNFAAATNWSTYANYMYVKEEE